MSCSFEIDKRNGGKNDSQGQHLSSVSEHESVREVSSCPLHGPSKEQHGRCWSDISCGLSGCYCVKKKSKINNLLRKILERKLFPASSSHQGHNSEKTWCKRRAQYYQHRLQISENINNHVLKLMKKHDLEVLLSALEQNTITSLEVNVIIIFSKVRFGKKIQINVKCCR